MTSSRIGTNLPETCLCCAVLSPRLNDSSRRHFVYNRLPQEPLRLSIFKLDGSCFEVNVSRTATVAELKEAVKDVFRQLPNETESNISWSHVWSHFCLSFKGQKLIDDKTYIRFLGIRDDDQARKQVIDLAGMEFVVISS
ncbi:hypothetical protein FEM48_Zijuj01G0189400 [Ziziphus jujuba var. spinosa]|uniref:SNRNP25 ubiquitin-like domain-containing protein n=1 Tax=Ziziphus jujuba var. spinosa TaxID=714518 RepID=A0A978W2Z8_ZIZJJ|nr:hypothetical protein FEM48_Zijuj01G0189400 [Ziziphus jujuba var. spinosa]